MSITNNLKKYGFIVLIISTLLSCKSKVGNEAIIIKGTIGNHFHLSSTENIEKNKRSDFLKEKDLKDISDRIDKLDLHFKLLNEGKEDEANEIIESDSTLSKSNQFGIAYGYMIIKMNQLDILFSPLIQCNSFNDSHLISVSEKELIALDDYLNNKKEVKLAIEKIGEIEMDKTNVYRLREINPK